MSIEIFGVKYRFVVCHAFSALITKPTGYIVSILWCQSQAWVNWEGWK